MPAAADDTCYTTSETGEDMVVVFLPHVAVAGGSGAYVASDLCQLDDDPCFFSIWFYEESNGIPGLQRDDEVRSDVAGCDGTVESDAMWS